MRKRRKHNKEDEVFNMKYVLEINHKIDMLKRLWSLFTQNKEWVLSLLFGNHRDRFLIPLNGTAATA